MTAALLVCTGLLSYIAWQLHRLVDILSRSYRDGSWALATDDSTPIKTGARDA